MKNLVKSGLLLLFFNSVINQSAVNAQDLKVNQQLDKQVQSFLNSNAGRWHDMNVPAVDGQLLHDIIIRNNYKSALEIGTSTGHSSIWIAWALSKTGGKLITIDIDEKINGGSDA